MPIGSKTIWKIFKPNFCGSIEKPRFSKNSNAFSNQIDNLPFSMLYFGIPENVGYMSIKTKQFSHTEAL